MSDKKNESFTDHDISDPASENISHDALAYLKVDAVTGEKNQNEISVSQLRELVDGLVVSDTISQGDKVAILQRLVDLVEESTPCCSKRA